MRTAAVMHALTRAVTAATIFVVPGDTHAQRVRLEVRPRVGDTLRLTLEHSVTVSGAARVGFAAIPPRTSAFHIATHEIVERTGPLHTSLRAIVDSAATSGGSGSGPALFPDLDRTLPGAQVHMDVAPDGASRVADGGSALDPELRALIGEMPAVLPRTDVAVGGTWTRDLPLPFDGSSSQPASVRATFRLDSLTANRSLAWISLTGTFTSKARSDTATRSESKGTLAGSMVLDRHRGWLLESHTTANIESVAPMPNSADPLVVTVRVVQSMKTASARR